MNVEDGSETALVEIDMTAVGSAGLRAVEGSTWNHSLMDPHFYLLHQVSVASNAFA